MSIKEIYRAKFARLVSSDYKAMSEIQLANKIFELYDLCESGNQYFENEDGEELFIWHYFQSKAYWNWSVFDGGWYHPSDVPTICDKSFLLAQDKNWLVAYILCLDLTFVHFNGGMHELCAGVI